MAFLTSENNGSDYEKPSTGLKQAVCVHVVDMGLRRTEFSGKVKEQNKLCFIFQLSEKDSDGKNFIIRSRDYTNTLDPRGNLRKDLESWRGKPFTKEEGQEFDLEKLVGANAMLNLILADEKYINISSYSPLMEGTPKMDKPNLAIPDYILKKANEGLALRAEVNGTTPVLMPIGDKPSEDLPF